jgi:hypothetical protein
MSVVDSEILGDLNHDNSERFERGIAAFEAWRKHASAAAIADGVIEALSSIDANEAFSFLTRYSRARQIIEIARLPPAAFEDVAVASRGWSTEVKNRVVAVLPSDMQHYAYANPPSTPGEKDNSQPEIEESPSKEGGGNTGTSNAASTTDDSPQPSGGDVYSVGETTEGEKAESAAWGVDYDYKTPAETEPPKASDAPSSRPADESIKTEADNAASVEPTIRAARSESRIAARRGSPSDSRIQVKPHDDGNASTTQGGGKNWWWFGAVAIAGLAAVAYFWPDDKDIKPIQNAGQQAAIVDDGTDASNQSGDTDSSTNNAQPENPPAVNSKFNAVDAIVVLGGRVRQDSNGQVLSVWLNDTSIKDDSLTHLENLVSLKELWLGSTKLDGSGLVHLKRMRRLETIDLGGCNQLQDSGLQHLDYLPRIREIWLWGCSNITDRGLAHIAKLSSLQSLDIRQTKVTAAGVARLQKALPRCKIEWDEP